jgi:hypothetical protein
MEQRTRRFAHIERILLVCGMPNAGKSTSLRQMYVDQRFGTQGILPAASRLRMINLSRERQLWIRLMSPHENMETIRDFLDTINQAAKSAWNKGWRINIACAVKPFATPKTPSAADICFKLKKEYLPERIRLIQLSPQQDGGSGSLLPLNEIDRLRTIEVEILTIDARRHIGKYPHTNGLLLADFFDFT